MQIYVVVDKKEAVRLFGQPLNCVALRNNF